MHTPGPWILERCKYKGLQVHGTNEENGGQMTAHAKIYDLNSAEITEANARLIAAAPELLEALKESVGRCADDKNCPLWLLEKWQTVINKAEA